MHIDIIENISKYTHMNPRFAIVAQYINDTELLTLEDGKHVIDGENVFIIMSTCLGQGRENVRLEAHRKYIDIQFCVAGFDEIGILPLAKCGDIAQEYDRARDIVFFNDLPQEWVRIDNKQCAILFPDDAHAPLSAIHPMKKVVIKIKV